MAGIIPPKIFKKAVLAYAKGHDAKGIAIEAGITISEAIGVIGAVRGILNEHWRKVRGTEPPKD